MKPTTKIILLFQVIPITLVLFQLGWLAFSLWYPYQFWGDTTTEYLTNFERFGADMVMHSFWVGIEWAAFFFLVGIPFEMVVLYNHLRGDGTAGTGVPAGITTRQASRRKR